jgi:hypothetical protein
MNNDKYAKYSNGRVSYGSNGAYTRNSGTSSKDNGCLGSLILMLAIPAGLLAWGVTYFL